MNGLIELWKQLKKGRVHCQESFAADIKTRKVLKEIKKTAFSAVSFDIGDANGVRFNYLPETARVPYPVSWFQYDDITEDTREKVKVGLLVSHNINEIQNLRIFQFISYRGTNNIFRLENAVCLPAYNSEGEPIAKFEAKDINDLWESFSLLENAKVSVCMASVGILFRFLNVMQCSNIEIVRAPLSTRERTVLRNKKLPILSSWTLHIKTDRKIYINENRSRTRNSPRVHLRRGHIREYAPGKKTWVQPCVVRGKSPGIIFKDYSMSKH